MLLVRVVTKALFIGLLRLRDISIYNVATLFAKDFSPVFDVLGELFNGVITGVDFGPA